MSIPIEVRRAGINISNTGTSFFEGIPASLSFSDTEGSKASQPAAQSNGPAQQAAKKGPTPETHNVHRQDIQGIKELIFTIDTQRQELVERIRKVNDALRVSKRKLTLSQIFLIALLKKSTAVHLQEAVQTQERTLNTLEEQLANSAIQLKVEFDGPLKSKYDRLVKAYRNLTRAEKIWSVKGVAQENNAKASSSDADSVQRRDVQIGYKSLPIIKFDQQAFYFANADQSDLYFYPGFLIAAGGQGPFTVIGYNELSFRFSATCFTEGGDVPSDSQVVGQAFANGSLGKSFGGGASRPIVQYGEIEFLAHTGLREAFQFSHYAYCREFASAFHDYLQTIVSLTGRPAEN
ncbi:hypothetical protein [Spirosoma aerophilum]